MGTDGLEQKRVETIAAVTSNKVLTSCQQTTDQQTREADQLHAARNLGASYLGEIFNL